MLVDALVRVLVVVAATTDGVAGPSCDHQHQADDEQDDPDGHAKLRIGERWRNRG